MTRYNTYSIFAGLFLCHTRTSPHKTLQPPYTGIVFFGKWTCSYTVPVPFRQHRVKRQGLETNYEMNSPTYKNIIIYYTTKAKILTDSHGKSLLGSPRRCTPSPAEHAIFLAATLFQLCALRVLNVYIIG